MAKYHSMLTFPCRQDDIIIAVMGITGCGKTTFVNLFADQQLVVGHTLDSCKINSVHSKELILSEAQVHSPSRSHRALWKTETLYTLLTRQGSMTQSAQTLRFSEKFQHGSFELIMPNTSCQESYIYITSWTTGSEELAQETSRCFVNCVETRILRVWF